MLPAGQLAGRREPDPQGERRDDEGGGARRQDHHRLEAEADGQEGARRRQRHLQGQGRRADGGVELFRTRTVTEPELKTLGPI